MRTEPAFARFARRLTRGYVVLAIALIALVGLTSSVLAFVLYAVGYNEALDAQQARVEQRVQYYQAQHLPLAKYAAKLIVDEEHSRSHIVVFDARHAIIAGQLRPPNRLAFVLAASLNMHPRHIHLADGEILLVPDFDGFLRLMSRYWSVLLPVGLIAVLLAWLAGRSITRRATRPLEGVTDALRAIAGGDLTPKVLLESDAALVELTQAYNDVAQRLNVATLERRRQDAELRQFIADAGHELRTPLTIFMGYLDALRSGVVTDGAAIGRVHDTMLDESRKMRTIIEKLILLARMEREIAPARDPVDLPSLAARAVDALRPLAGDRVRLTQADEATLLGDDGELYEAVKNVIENAVRYAPDSPVEVRVARANGTAVVEVSDRGPGMAPVDAQHAFDRFYRGSTHGEVEGSGLGLAIAKRAVERVGGSVALETAPGLGTKVALSFPIDKSTEPNEP
ncbi:MAG: HAMP domain-containing histidine kinase [bacterium]|nr:HAMP domain-containing histidine kinase [bacterium]